MNKTILIIGVLILAIVGVYYMTANNNYTKTPSYATPSTNSVDTTAPAQTSEPQTSAANVSAAPAPTPIVSPLPASITVNIKNFSFNPPSLKIKTGTKITWINNDVVDHTVTSDTDTLLDSPALSSGRSFSFTFAKTGTVNYHCNIHPTMKGSIVITN